MKLWCHSNLLTNPINHSRKQHGLSPWVSYPFSPCPRRDICKKHTQKNNICNAWIFGLHTRFCNKQKLLNASEQYRASFGRHSVCSPNGLLLFYSLLTKIITNILNGINVGRCMAFRTTLVPISSVFCQNEGASPFVPLGPVRRWHQ